MRYVPLDHEFSSTDAPATSAPEGSAQVTTLSNGIRVVSHDSVHPVANVGVTIASGSRYEDTSNHGINSVLAAAALKTTTNRSAFRFANENQMLGNAFNVTAGRENITYTVSALQDHAAHALGSLGDVVANSKFSKPDLAVVKDRYLEFVAEENDRNPDMVEAIHAAAYRGNTLGHPLSAFVHHMDQITPYALVGHTERFFTGERMVVSGSGVEHSRLVDLVNETFADVPASGPAVEKIPAQYTGGEVAINQVGEDGLVHFTIGFEVSPSDAAAALVLQSVLGNSADVTSRIALTSGGLAVSSNAFLYSDSGLLTLSGSTLPSSGGALSGFLVDTALGMAEVSDAEVAVAKARAATSVLTSLSARSTSHSALAATLLRDGSLTTAADITAAIAAVTTADVQRVATAALSSKISSCSLGEPEAFPHTDLIEANFTPRLTQ